MTQPAATATRLDKIAAGIGRIVSPNRRLEAANALLEAVPDFANELRAVRAQAIRDLRAAGATWVTLGELLNVSPQRAQQMSSDPTTERTATP